MKSAFETIQNTISSYLEQFASKLIEMFTGKNEAQEPEQTEQTEQFDDGSLTLSAYEVDLLKKGVPFAVIQQGDNAVQEYAQINNIEL